MSVDCGVSFPFISNHVSQLLMVPEDYKAFLSTLKLDWTLQGLPLSHLVPLWRRRLDEEGGTCLGEATLQDPNSTRIGRMSAMARRILEILKKFKIRLEFQPWLAKFLKFRNSTRI